jgi:uncharacterized damage-inducible protein DinB
MHARSEDRLALLLAQHEAAVRKFVDVARAIDIDAWLTPRAAGKWTPAQETKHITLVYTLFWGQLAKGTRVRLRGTRFSRTVWRLIGFHPILFLRRIPMAVDAPREVRPEWVVSTSAELLPELEQAATLFASEFEHVWGQLPQPVMMHPLIGRMSLDQGMRFLCVHTRHHAGFLPEPSPSRAIP